MANGRCYHHGGPSPGAPIKHGRYSKHLGRLAEAYEESLASSSLLSLREPLALLDSITRKHAERAADCDTPEFRKRALDLLQANDFENLEKLLKAGVAEDRSTKTLVTHIEKLSKRIEGAWQVKLARSQSINSRELVAIFARIVDILRTELPPADFQRTLARIDTEILRGAHRLPPRSVEPEPAVEPASEGADDEC